MEQKELKKTPGFRDVELEKKLIDIDEKINMVLETLKAIHERLFNEIN